MEKSDKSRTRGDEQRRKYSKMDKRAKDKMVRSPREIGGRQDAQKDLRSRTGKDEKKGKTQEKMERGSRKRSSSAGSEKMKRVGGRQEKKRKDIVRQGKAHSGLQCRWKKKKKEEEEEEEEKEEEKKKFWIPI